MEISSMSMSRRGSTCCPARISSSRVVPAPRPRGAVASLSAVAAGRLSTTPSLSGAFTASPLSATRFPAMHLSARSLGPASTKMRTIVAVARPQSSESSASSASSSSKVKFPSILVAFFFTSSLFLDS